MMQISEKTMSTVKVIAFGVIVEALFIAAMFAFTVFVVCPIVGCRG